MTIDVRTRTDDDIRAISAAQFFDHELPRLLPSTGPLAARGAKRLGLGPITLRIDGTSYTLRATDDTIEINPARTVEGAVIVAMSGAALSVWVQEVRSMLALLHTGDAEVVGGDSNAALGWDAVLRAMVDARPIYEPGAVTLTNDDGTPLDINRSFTLNADDAEMGRFLQQAGFLMLRGWIDADVVQALNQDIDQGLGTAERDDPRRWWARLEDGREKCVRIKHFADISVPGKLAAESYLFHRICGLTGDEFAFPPSWVESLVKPTGVLAGPSEISWHKDCWQGKHPFFCSGMTIGILLAPSNEVTGGFHVMAGSHRANFPAVDRNIDDVDLPTRFLYGEPGDVTVHLSCAMHETTPPRTGERRVMYAGFSLVNRSTGEGIDNRYSIKHSEWSEAVSAAWQTYA